MDSSLLHADIFFVITSVAVVLLTIVAVVVLIYLMKIMAEVRALVKFTHAEAETLSQDLAEFRQKLQAGAFLGWLVQMFVGAKKKRSKQREEE